MSQTDSSTTQRTVVSMRRPTRAGHDRTWRLQGPADAEGMSAGRSSTSSTADSGSCPIPPTHSRPHPGGDRLGLLQVVACLYLTLLRPCTAAELVHIASTRMPAIEGGRDHSQSMIKASTCQPLSLPTCRDSSMVPWNTTSLPNLLQHDSQEEAASALFQDFRPLLSSNCSRLLPTFLCAVYAPPCPHHRHHHQSTGEGSMKPSAQSSLNNIPGCKCKKERKLGKKVYMSSSFDYAMKGTYLSTKGIKGGPMVITVRAEEVLKTSRVQIPDNTSLTLWVGKGCVCPRLIAGHKYIFLGYEDAVNKRLLFDRNSVAMSWKEGWRRLVVKWETRLQRKLARDRRRRKRKRMGLQDKIFERRTQTYQDLKTHRREGRREQARRVRGRHGGRRHHSRPGS